MARDCPFLEWSSSSGFFGGYRCKVTKDSILTGSAIYENFCHNWESGYSRCPHMKGEENTSSCFITSACIKAQGLPDDCHTLTVLRHFRDSWLAKQPNGEKEIESYYNIAPDIVRRINCSPNSQAKYQFLLDNFINPCVSLIEKQNYQAAFEKYKEMVQKLQEGII